MAKKKAKSPEELNLQEAPRLMAIAQLDGIEFDVDLEPHVLTDKADAKALPCRVCRRPCVVTRFASAAKTACHDHRDRHAPVTAVHELKSDLEPHVLTDKAETKEVPCRTCGRPCIVTRFASASKVACNDCRESTSRPRVKTEYTPNAEGRMTATTTVEIMSEQDLQWQRWTVEQPFNFERVWSGDEKDQHNQHKNAYFEAHCQIRTNKRALHKLEEDLVKFPDMVNAAKALARVEQEGNEKSVKEKQSVIDKINKIEAEIDTLVAQTGELEEAKASNEKASDRLARIAYFRGALNVGYRIETRDDRRYLVGRERKAAIPDGFLDDDGYKLAEKKIPVVV